jgi:hypothetical protein
MNQLIDLLKTTSSADCILIEDAILKLTGKYVQAFTENNKVNFFHKVTGREIIIDNDKLIEINNIAYLFNSARNCKSIGEKERLLPQLLPYIESRKIKYLFPF